MVSTTIILSVIVIFITNMIMNIHGVVTVVFLFLITPTVFDVAIVQKALPKP